MCFIYFHYSNVFRICMLYYTIVVVRMLLYRSHDYFKAIGHSYGDIGIHTNQCPESLRKLLVSIKISFLGVRNFVSIFKDQNREN